MVLLGVFGKLHDIIKIDGKNKSITDNIVFRLHYKWTRLLLFVFCIIVSLNSLVGKPIACTGASSDRLQHVMQTYCWITGTFTYEKYFGSANQIGDDKLSVIGIGPGHPEKDEKHHITYYQWVPVVLFLQGVSFYIPHWIWKMFEDHRIRKLVDSMVETKLEEKKRRERQGKVIRYLLDSQGCSRWYAYQYVFCEVLNLLNAVMNIALVDKFLGGNFFTLGTKLIQYDPEDPKAIDPSHYTFPKQTKCTFHLFGLSGTTERVDSICILPVNIFNEKLYAVMWFWFILLTAVTAANLVWRVAMMVSPVLRVWILQMKGHSRDVGNMHVVSQVVNSMTFSDFFFVWLFTKNLNGVVLFDFLREYSKTVGNQLSTDSSRMYPTLPHMLELKQRKSINQAESEKGVQTPLTPSGEDDDVLYASIINKRRA
ncbi:innexin inx3-like [Pollicipes pollicipes]|uniref:innexin inx3-like n=1 Tax=Pollicipes pollicipes TaxID=41117 RepID=UPI0018859F72|nr:innexin inx3-like [Pollicipes pollicipes]